MINACDSENATVKYMELPEGIHGATMPLDNASRFIVVINNTRTPEQQARTLRHELGHIRLGHFKPEALSRSLEEIEAEADQYADTVAIY